MVNIKHAVQLAASKDKRIISVSLLGSYFKGNYTESSDIDLGIMINENFNFTAMDRVNLATELSIELKKSVDIGIISSKNLVYSKEALLNGKIIYTSDEYKTNLTRSTLLGMYLDFNHNRQEILNEYKA